MIRRGSGPGIRSAMPAGDRKMPDPIVDPTTTAVALQTPIRRGRPEDTGEFIRPNLTGRCGGREKGVVRIAHSLSVDR
jgi:hypothetical protein